MCGSKYRFRWKIGPVSERYFPTRKRATLMLTLKDTQQVVLTVVAEDAKGNPTTLANAPSWTVSDPTILTITSAADNMSATVAATGTLGTAQVTVTANVNGNTETGTLDVQVVAGDAVTLVINADVPTDVPTPAPAPTP